MGEPVGELVAWQSMQVSLAGEPSAPRRRGLCLTDEMCRGLARRKVPRRLAELCRLNRTTRPSIEDLDYDCSGLQPLGAHRPDCIGDDMCPRVHSDHLQNTVRKDTNSGRTGTGRSEP
jgi:hypothetical protein